MKTNYYMNTSLVFRTYLAIMLLVDKISEALDQGECVVGVF